MKLAICEELAAKVRGYFTNRYGEVADFNTIPAKMDGDRDLYDLASQITSKVIQPGTKLPKKRLHREAKP
jgi:hypothetical protein